MLAGAIDHGESYHTYTAEAPGHYYYMMAATIRADRGAAVSWDLDAVDADPRNRRLVDPMDDVLRRRNGRANGPPEPPADFGLVPLYPDRSVTLVRFISADGAHVVEVGPTGVVLVRVLPGPVDAHLELIGPRPA